MQRNGSSRRNKTPQAKKKGKRSTHHYPPTQSREAEAEQPQVNAVSSFPEFSSPITLPPVNLDNPGVDVIIDQQGTNNPQKWDHSYVENLEQSEPAEVFEAKLTMPRLIVREPCDLVPWEINVFQCSSGKKDTLEFKIERLGQIHNVVQLYDNIEIHAINYPNIRETQAETLRPESFKGSDKVVDGLTAEENQSLGWLAKGPMSSEYAAWLTCYQQGLLSEFYSVYLCKILERGRIRYMSDASHERCLYDLSRGRGPIFNIYDTDTDGHLLARGIPVSWGDGSNREVVLDSLWVEASGIVKPSVYCNGRYGLTAFHPEDHKLPSINQFLYGPGIKMYLDVKQCHAKALVNLLIELSEVACHRGPYGIYHKGLVVTPEQLTAANIPYSIILQRAGCVFMSPTGGWHQVISIGESIAEACNLIGEQWKRMTQEEEGRAQLFGVDGKSGSACPGVEKGTAGHSCWANKLGTVDSKHRRQIDCHLGMWRFLAKEFPGKEISELAIDLSKPNHKRLITAYCKFMGQTRYVNLWRDDPFHETLPKSLPITSLGIERRRYGIRRLSSQPQTVASEGATAEDSVSSAPKLRRRPGLRARNRGEREETQEMENLLAQDEQMARLNELERDASHQAYTAAEEAQQPDVEGV